MARRTTLGALGAKHVEYGVTDEMYDQVGDALLATLAEVAAEAWTPEVAAQWTLAYGAIAGMMQAGAAGAAPRPPLATHSARTDSGRAEDRATSES